MLPLKKSICLCLFAFTICFASTIAVGISSENLTTQKYQIVSHSTRITDVNDDCLYGTFALLDAKDLNSVISTNRRFASIARHLFHKRSIEWLVNWRNDCIQNRLISVDPFLSTKAMNFIRIFIPTDNSLSSDQKFVLLFKYISVLALDYNFVLNVPRFMEILEPYITQHMDEENHIEEFADTLTLHDHYAIMQHYSNRFHEVDEEDFGWLCYAYMMILEKSKKHLNHQFTYAMMLKVDRIRNAANAFSLLYHEVFSKRTTFKEDMLSYLGKLPFTFGLPSWNKPKEGKNATETFVFDERFQLDWDLYKGKTPSEDTKGKFHLVVARGSVYNLHRKYFLDRISETGLHYFARVYFAIRSLSGPQFKKLVNSTNLNFAIFDLDKKHKIVEMLRQSLETLCNGTEAVETGLQQQIDNLDQMIGQKMGSEEGIVLLMTDLIQTKFYKQVAEKIREESDRLINAEDFSDYINLLKSCTLITRLDAGSLITGAFLKLFYTYFTFVDRPSAFDDANQLSEVDRLHTKLFNQNPIDFKLVRLWAVVNDKKGNRLQTALNNFDSILAPRKDDGPETRNKQRIVLKMLIFLANNRGRTVTTEGGHLYENTIKIVELFYSLAVLDGEAIARDSYLLYQWNDFNDNMPVHVKRLYLRTDIDQFAIVYQPYLMTGDVTTDAFVYLECLKIAEIMATYDEVIPNQVLENILALEEGIGEAETTEPYLQAEILKQKFKFYKNYSIIVREKLEQTNLKKFVESSVDLLLSQTKSDCEIKILHSIYVAVQNNRGTARQQLGTDLIEKLGQLPYDAANARSFNQIKSDYEAFRKILQIENSIAIQE